MLRLCHGERESLGLAGCAVRQDGRSASLTAPSGQAQQALLCAALADAAITADALALSETHGTGTELGDPIEAGSLVGAVLSARSAGAAAVGVCGVKANIGHAEPAAGLTGLLAVTCALSGGTVTPNAQLRALNVHLSETMSGGRCALPTQLAAGTGRARDRYSTRDTEFPCLSASCVSALHAVTASAVQHKVLALRLM